MSENPPFAQASHAEPSAQQGESSGNPLSKFLNIDEAKKKLAERGKAAGLILEEVTALNALADEGLRLGLKCGRNTRWVGLWSAESIEDILAIPFEKYIFLSELEAICSYNEVG